MDSSAGTGGRAESLGNGQRSGVVTASSVWRRFGGCSRRPCHRVRLDLARAHSRCRITREWSRRARPSCAIMSPKRAAHSQRYTDKVRRNPGSFVIGIAAASRPSSRRRAASRGGMRRWHMGALGRIDLRRGNEEPEHLAAAAIGGALAASRRIHRGGGRALGQRRARVRG
jgi:hypothetical protein